MLEEQQDQLNPQAASEDSLPKMKRCPRCGALKPFTHFKRRSGKETRRGICRACRKKSRSRLPAPVDQATGQAETAAVPFRRLVKRPLPAPPPKPRGPDAAILRPNKDGIIKMRGHTDKGRRWLQETDLETASVLVREYAAVVVNPHTIRRLYSNKKFRRYILQRDQYTCYYCGEYGDTIDHLLPRAKGGHTTPLNCVCACNLCNQNKADRSLDDFMSQADPQPGPF